MPKTLLHIISLNGLTMYDEAHSLQQHLVTRRITQDIPDTLILLEHPPVVTIGNSGKTSDITVPTELLETQGISVRRIERGGQVTYHGPGQIVGYAIMNLRALKIGVAVFINRLEEILIRTAAQLGINAVRKPGAPGVYVEGKKIGAIGVRVTRGITFHGFAFNLAPNLDHYKFINPCGMTAADVTSVKAHIQSVPSIEETKDIIATTFATVFDKEPMPSSAPDILLLK